jgi:chromosome segregation ATPase
MEALLEKEGTVESGNDDRLDELSRRVDKGFEEAATKVELTALKNEMNLRFDRVDERFDEFSGRFGDVGKRLDEVNGRFGEVGKRFDKIDGQLMHINDRLDRMNHTLLVGAFGVVAAVLANGFFG